MELSVRDRDSFDYLRHLVCEILIASATYWHLVCEDIEYSTVFQKKLNSKLAGIVRDIVTLSNRHFGTMDGKLMICGIGNMVVKWYKMMYDWIGHASISNVYTACDTGMSGGRVSDHMSVLIVVRIERRPFIGCVKAYISHSAKFVGVPPCRSLTPFVLFLSIQENMSSTSGVSSIPIWKLGITLSFMWSIWYHRNQLTWQHKDRNIVQFSRSYLAALWNARRALDRSQGPSGPTTGCSAFVRDDTGGSVSCRTGFTDGVLSPEAAELIAIHVALRWLSSMQVDNVVIESDCPSVVLGLNGASTSYSEIGNLFYSLLVPCKSTMWS
ncbi:hypothetical protein EPI10_020974 [Gossypium australe]|uniref:RNase H type-1 domain-containing protein n=1 Tax=Gossypium australe TaxID=47621 RepID=A0A5B6WFE4_9ROSI|nr:hypothetical protein EPI10_020974 [Gossypium australe]